MLEAELGRGGMGRVFRARDERLGRAVAVKVLRPESAANPDFRARFAREARLLAQLEHPGIVAVHDFGTTPAGDGYLVMQLVSGGSIADRLPLPVADALAIAVELCGALAYAHGRGIIHRDIKPENVLIGDDGRARLSDFGIARLVDPTPEDGPLTRPSLVLGTPGYMAPEARAGARPDPRMDVYAVGALLAHMLTGRHPDVADGGPPISGGAATPHVPAAIAAVIARATAVDPARRTAGREDAGRRSGRARRAVQGDAARGARPAARGACLARRGRAAGGGRDRGRAVRGAGVADPAHDGRRRRGPVHRLRQRAARQRPGADAGPLRGLADAGRRRRDRHRARRLRPAAPPLARGRAGAARARSSARRQPARVAIRHRAVRAVPAGRARQATGRGRRGHLHPGDRRLPRADHALPLLGRGARGASDQPIADARAPAVAGARAVVVPADLQHHGAADRRLRSLTIRYWIWARISPAGYVRAVDVHVGHPAEHIVHLCLVHRPRARDGARRSCP